MLTSTLILLVYLAPVHHELIEVYVSSSGFLEGKNP